MSKQHYPSDVSDAEWSFVAPYLTLMKEEAPQREHANEQDRSQVGKLAKSVQEATGKSVQIA